MRAAPSPVTFTRTRTLRSLSRTRARWCRHWDSLRTFREHLSRHAARRPLYTGSHGATCFPNSHHHRHFNRARAGFVPSTRRFRASFPIRSCARLGRPQNTKRTSHRVPQSRCGFQNNSVRPIWLAVPVRYTTHVSCLDRSASQFHACTHSCHVIRSLDTFQHTLWDIHIMGLC